MSKKVSLANRKRTKDLAKGGRVDPKVDQKHEELLALKPETITATTPVVKHFDEVRKLVEALKAYLIGFNETSSDHRLQYSRQAQHDMLMDEIKSVLADKAETEMAKGTSEERIIMICQALADDVRIGLAREGIQINPLHLSQKHKARMWLRK